MLFYHIQNKTLMVGHRCLPAPASISFPPCPVSSSTTSSLLLPLELTEMFPLSEAIVWGGDYDAQLMSARFVLGHRTQCMRSRYAALNLALSLRGPSPPCIAWPSRLQNMSPTLPAASFSTEPSDTISLSSATTLSLNHSLLLQPFFAEITSSPWNVQLPPFQPHHLTTCRYNLLAKVLVHWSWLGWRKVVSFIRNLESRNLDVNTSQFLSLIWKADYRAAGRNRHLLPSG